MIPRIGGLSGKAVCYNHLHSAAHLKVERRILLNSSIATNYLSTNPKILLQKRYHAQKTLPQIICASSSLAGSSASPNNNNEDAKKQQPAVWSKAASTVYYAACLSTFMAAVGRVSFSVLAVPIQQQYNLRLTEMGLLQSAMLIGYVLGQVPAGIIADRLGGPQTLCAGLIAWSVASMAMALSPFVPWPLAVILISRAALGLAQAVMMPGVSASSAQWFPAAVRASRTSGVYAWYSLGTVLGLSATPAIASIAGWPNAFLAFGAAGVVLGLFALRSLPKLPEEYIKQQMSTKRRPRSVDSFDKGDSSSSSDEESNTSSTSMSSTGSRKALDWDLVLHHAPDMLLLCFTHGVIGFGFFVLQSWVPTFLYSLSLSGSGAPIDLTTLGLLSAAPWLFTAAVAIRAGALADWLQIKAKWTAVQVRHAMQTAASVGACLALAPLALFPSSTLSPTLATVALSVAVASQGFNYGGYHAYVQDVAPGDAGLILGLTNTFSSVAGIVGNIVAGALAGGPAGFAAVFGLTVVLHAMSAVTWLVFARGKKIRLTS
jgi:MFS family permease